MNNLKISEKKILYKPIKYVMFFNFFLIILFAFGPLEWKPESPVKLYVFLFSVYTLFFLGYFLTMKRKEKIYIESYANNKNTRSYNKRIILIILKYLIFINLIFTILTLIRLTGLSSFSINSIINNFIKGLTDPSGQYSLKSETEKVFGGGIFPKVSTLFSPILWPIIPLSIMFFKDLSIKNRVFTICTLLFESIRWISIGTNKGIIDLILIIFSIIFLKSQQRNCEKISKKEKTKKINIKKFVPIISFVYLGLYIFQNNISSRVNSDYSLISSLTNGTKVNIDRLYLLIFPYSIRNTLVYVSQYLTQGFYGLSLTFNEPFIPMFGIGNSYFLIQKFSSFLNIDLWKFTYQSRIEYKGWPSLTNWHSAYSWLANDISYAGVLILMFFFGMYFANVYFRALVFQDIIGIILFCLIILSCFYMSSNNQILSYPNTFMSFWFFNIIWFIKKLSLKR